MQGLCNKNALAKMLIQIGGVSVVYQWKSVVKFVAFPVVCKWYISKSAVKFGGVISVVYQWYISGVTTSFQWKPVVLPLLSTDITEEFSGNTVVLPLEFTVLPVVIPPNFTTDFHWYTTGNTTAIQLVISNCLSIKYVQGEKDDHMYLEKFQREMLGKMSFGHL